MGELFRRYWLPAILAADPPGLAWDVEDDNSYDDLYLVSGLIDEDRDWESQVPKLTTHTLASAR